MASLMKKLFDTMPLAGVEGALRDAVGSLKYATVAQLARNLTFIERLSGFQVKSKRPSPQLLKTFDGKWDRIPIWGYRVPADPTRVEQVSCRVRDDNYNEYVVLDRIEWGYAPVHDPTSFRAAIGVVFHGNALELPLTEEFRLMSFSTVDGQNDAGVHWLWPLDARHDPALLHVFAYDLHRSTGALVSLKAPGHPQSAEVGALLERCRRLNAGDANDDENAWDFLFKDNLWDASFVAAPPAGTVPEDVDLSLPPVRILVACSLTACREKDDFQPGRPMGVGRVYPHVMVVATAQLDEVNAGVRLSRPQNMTLLDGEHCGCSEMLSAIHGLLVADSNADAMPLATPGAPFIYLANLFNYYVTDPFADPALRNTAIPIVRRSRPTARNQVGYVSRDCSDIMNIHHDENKFRVTKFPRQGQFDNLHLAPRMKVTDKIDRVVVNGIDTAPFTTYEAWKMDVVTMAPFCAHDCFHMHWRWSDNANTESSTFGWGPKSPYQEVGRVMVPENQDAYLVLLAHNAFSYLAQAQTAPADKWQPFCHHGAGYGLNSGLAVSAAKLQASQLDTVRFEQGPTGKVTSIVNGGWALFYWRLRYRFRTVKKIDESGKASFELEVEERFSFTDRAKALGL